jgi:hypothetical protein
LEQTFLKELFAAHDTQNIQSPGGFVVAIEKPAGRLDKLAIAGTWAQLRNGRSHLRVLGQQVRMRKDPAH